MYVRLGTLKLTDQCCMYQYYELICHIVAILNCLRMAQLCRNMLQRS